MSEDSKYHHQLIRQMNESKAKAAGILDAAELEGRSLTDEERAEVKGHTADAARWSGILESSKEQRAFRRAIEELNPAGPITDTVESEDLTLSGVKTTDTLGEIFVKSGVGRALKAAKVEGRLPEKFRTQGVTVPYGFGRKAGSSPLLESNTAEVFAAFRTLLPGVETPGLVQLRPTIADVLPVIQITVGNTAVWREATARDTLALSDVPVAEGSTKPTVAYDFNVRSAQLIKIAAITKMSEEYLEDDTAIVSFVNADLPLQIRYVEEDYLADVLYDSVTDASSLSGASTPWDEILAAATVIQEAGGSPDAFLVTPTNWAEMLVSKFSGGDEHYTGGGPFSSTGNPWSLRPIVTRAATNDHPLVGDFGGGARLFRKGAIRLDSTNSDEDDFQNNLVTIRAEMREKVVKTYPEFFKTADIS